jgi:hypothetical protein
MSQEKQLAPSYDNIKVPSTSPAYKYTQQNLPTIRIKEEPDIYSPKNNNLTNKYTTYI